MKKIKLFVVLLAASLVFTNSSFTAKKASTSYWCYGVINKTWNWPGTWRYTLMNLDCSYVMDWGCVVGWNDCTVCIDPWDVTIISDNGCMLTIDVPWQYVFVERMGDFTYEIY